MFGFKSACRFGINEDYWKVLRRMSFTFQGNCVSEVVAGFSFEEMVIFSDSGKITISAGQGSLGRFETS